MFPTLIDFGTRDLPLVGPTHLFLPTYGVLFATAALVCGWWFLQRGRQLGQPEDQLFNLLFYGLLAGILGAKLTLVALNWRDYLNDPRLLVGTLRSAGVLIGGVIAGGVMFGLYARRQRMPAFQLLDAIAAPLALGQSIGRLGCFFAGCCWGVPTDRASFFGVTFTNPVAREQTGVPLDVPLVATQLAQSINDLVLALVLTWLWRKRPEPAGTVFWIYVLLYSISRGIIEFWRGDAQRGLFFDNGVSTSQLFALGGIVLAVSMILRGRKRLGAADGA